MFYGFKFTQFMGSVYFRSVNLVEHKASTKPNDAAAVSLTLLWCHGVMVLVQYSKWTALQR